VTRQDYATAGVIPFDMLMAPISVGEHFKRHAEEASTAFPKQAARTIKDFGCAVEADISALSR
jgi:hypothetical protein